MDPINLQFTYQELLADLGSKQLIIQRQAARIAELEEALLATAPDAPLLKAVPATETNGKVKTP